MRQEKERERERERERREKKRRRKKEKAESKGQTVPIGDGTKIISTSPLRNLISGVGKFCSVQMVFFFQISSSYDDDSRDPARFGFAVSIVLYARPILPIAAVAIPGPLIAAPIGSVVSAPTKIRSPPPKRKALRVS